MPITLSQLTTIQNTCNVSHMEADVYYPRLILFENSLSVRIVNILNSNKNSDQSGIYQFKESLTDKLLLENFLWLIFKSGEIKVINVLKGLCISIANENGVALKIHQVARGLNRLYFLSESGDSFEIPYSFEELTQKLHEGSNNLLLPFKKKQVSNLYFQMKYHTLCGMNTFIKNGVPMLMCPHTGLKETILTEVELNYHGSWRDLSIFANNSNMWIVNMKISEIIFVFENQMFNYLPVSVYNDSFYYLLWNSNEVQICKAVFTQSALMKHPASRDCSETLDQAATSQDTLKNQLSALSESIADNTKPLDVLPQLQSLFEVIDDFKFLIDLCEKLCHYNLQYKSLLYSIQKRLLAINDNKFINMVTNLSIKIDLIEYIQFTGNTNYKNINLLKLNYKELCITFIAKHDFDIASICWLKFSQLELIITSDDVIDILNAINNNAKIASIIIWLKNLIPPLLEQNPFYIDNFVRWATERVFTLEQSAYWPKVGVKFVEEIIFILETSFNSIAVRPVSMDDLDLLKTRIMYIIELKEKYKINILLNELSSQSPHEVALIMLRRCYTEDIKLFLQNYLPSYAMQHMFDLDDILTSYIKSEAASSGGGIDGTRLKMLLEAFHSYSNKLDCLLEVLKVLDVPWNDSVVELAMSIVTETNKNFTISDTERLLSLEIQKEINYANVKVVLKKYNFPMSCTNYITVLHKIVSGAVIELKDLNTITSVMPTYTNYGNILYLERCLQDCETRTALNYFNKLTSKEKKLLLKAVVAKYDLIISGSTNNISLERNYIDFIKGTELLNEFEMENIENLYHFKNSSGLLLSLNDIYNENASEKICNSCIYQDPCPVSLHPKGSIIQLRIGCRSKYSILMNLLQGISTCYKVRQLVECLIRSFSTKDVLLDELISVLSLFHYGENSDLLLKCYNVFIELALKCSEEYLHSLMNQLSLINTLVNVSIVVKNLSLAWKFQYIFLPILTNTAVNDLIIFQRPKQYLKNISSDTSNVYSKCDFIALRQICSSVITDNTVESICADNVIEIAKRLLGKVVAVQELDEVLVTNLLLIIKSYEGNAWILEVLRGQNEFIPHHILCYLASPPLRRTFIFENDSFIREIDNSSAYPPQHILKTKFSINLEDIALPENSEETWDVKVILFYVLLHYPDTRFERLIDLCRALNISINEGLTLQLIALLSTWELKYSTIVDDLGHKQILIENDLSYFSKCCIIWDSLDNKDLLKDILHDFWKNGEITLHGRIISINPYYYEVFLCIYRLIFGTSCEIKYTKEYFLLHFLQDYRRKNSPKQYEYELFSVKGIFPEIGHYRLPFYLFMREDMWANLKSEITLETYERWLPAVNLLSLDSDMQTARDMICSNAVKQTMTTRKQKDDTNLDTKHEPWRLTSQEEPLLRAAHRCVKHIANMEWAGACLFYVLQGCACGADQVAAAHLCFQFAQRWAALQPGNRAVRQMERLYSTLSTRHALYKIDWASEELLRLSTEPTQLIRTIYLHSDFVSKMNHHDVNNAVNEIADKNGINVSSIRIQILENILNKSNTGHKNMLVLNIKELMIAKYILRATCPKMGAIYLSRIAFDDESENNKSKKLRALQCLISVVDSDTAIKVANKDRQILWSSLWELFSVVNLEFANMPWIAATFIQDKNRGLEQLLQTVETNADGLRTAAQVVYRYGSIQIIRSLIPLLLRTSLYEEMIPLLLKLSSRIDNVLCSAWRAVILWPFQRADYPITERQRVRCLRVINLLPVCPLVTDEDLIEIWKNCLRFKCFGLGCLVLPYITSQTRQKLTELQKIDRRNLIASLKNLNSETFLVSGAMHVIEKMVSRVYR